MELEQEMSEAPKDKNELLPCPFCGVNGVSMKSDWDSFDEYVECDDCLSRGPSETSENGAAAAWNDRANCAEHARLMAEKDAEIEEAFARGVNWAQERAKVEGRLVLVDSPELVHLRDENARLRGANDVDVCECGMIGPCMWEECKSPTLEKIRALKATT
jgi:Lar family restriction alleviation protein